MQHTSRSVQLALSVLIVLSISLQGPPPAAAQAGSGVRFQHHSGTGKLSFIGAPPGQPIVIPGAQAPGLAQKDRALVMLAPYAADFGLKQAGQELKAKQAQAAPGRQITRFQQTYQGIPVMGGELVVNATDSGGLLSIGGEISPDLNLNTTPSITMEVARQAALGTIAKLYKGQPTGYQASNPELWIYDARLLHPDGTPPALVWRMDVTGKQKDQPLDELVLVDAQRGNILLHFNQVDTAWGSQPAPAADTATATGPVSDPAAPRGTVQALTSNQRYIATTGTDTGACTSSASPCLTFNYALGQASAGDTLNVANGTYTGIMPLVNITKSISIMGGWNASFTTDNGQSILDGNSVNQEIVYIYGSGLAVNISQLTTRNGGVGIVSNNTGGTLNLNRVALVSGNHGFTSTGLFNWDGTVNLTNSTISGDYSWATSGTGIHIEAGNVNIQYSTITNNSGPSDYAIDAYLGAHLEIGNSILAGNTDADCSVPGSNNVISDGHNIFGSSPACYSYASPAFVPAATDLVGVNPRLTPLLPGGYHALLPGSPAIDAASATGCPATDQRGAARPYGAGCDIGAYEFGQPGSVPALLIPYLGANQIIPPGTRAPSDMIVFVADSKGQRVSGVAVTFMAPSSGPGGTFSNGTQTITVQSDANGIADAGAFTSNGIGGGYTIAATASGVTTSAVFPVISANPDISTYTMNGSQVDANLPGTLVCSSTTPGCTNGTDPDADHAQQFTFDTFSYYASRFNRNSVDNAGLPLLSSVHYGLSYPNAFWNGSQMVYGNGYSDGLDVVAHELTHGVTQHSSGMFEFYQSGAINESISDVMGELIQHSYQGTNDNWLVGENIVPGGAIRSMQDPRLYGDPDKMSSAYYDFDPTEADNGGVHHNNGISNKAAYLMAAGGTFNGKTVTAIGPDKTAAIYYEVDTHLLTSGSDYADLYVDLYQACLNLVGSSAGISLTDCASVQNAVDAVEMNGQPAANYNTDAPVCATGVPNVLFYDGFENGAAAWVLSSPRWTIDSPYGRNAASGSHSLFGDDYSPANTDAIATMASAVSIPAGAYLRFAQSYDFEHYAGDPNWYSGGVLEYSANGGAWTDAGSLIDSNGYGGTIASGFGNPLAGRPAFVGSSNGYIATRLNLSSLAGKNVKFRWSMGLSSHGSNLGWWLDNVQVYSCAASLTISGNAGIAATHIQVSGIAGQDVTADGSGNYTVSVPSGWTGTLTPALTGYTFVPGSRSYSNLAASLTSQDFTAYADNTTVDIASTLEGQYYVASGGHVAPQFPVLNGPVDVHGSVTLFASERVHNSTGFINEVTGVPDNQITNEYWFPWYDNLTMQTWILVGNPSASATAHVHIYIAGEDMNPAGYSISPGGRITPTFARLNGPVHIVSDNNVFASERVHTGQGFVQETMGYPNNQLAVKYWFPWYDNQTMQTWLLVGNPSATTTAHVHIYIAGEDMNPAGYDIMPGGRITPQYSRLNGPVLVESDNPVFTSERVHNATGFVQETMGVPDNQLTTEYWFPWYDNDTMQTWLLVGNPSTTATAHVHIYIAGTDMNPAGYAIAPGGRVTPTFPVLNGPVHIVSDVNVFTSERVHTAQGFVQETMGIPNTQLTTRYWLPWYDNLSMQSWILVGRP